MYDLIIGSRGCMRLPLLAVTTAAIIGLSLPASAAARKNPCTGVGVPSFDTIPASETSELDPSVTGMFAFLRRPAGPEDQVPQFNPLRQDLGYQLRGYFPAYVRQIIDELGGHRPQYIDVSCQPFAAVQSGARLIATEESTSDVLELAPDGVATVRLLYRNGGVVAAPVIDNVFSFTPPQRLIKEAVVRAQRFVRELRKEPRARRPHALRRLAKFFSEALNGVHPQTVEWLSANGQPLRIFWPRTEAGALSVGPGSVITIAGGSVH